MVSGSLNISVEVPKTLKVEDGVRGNVSIRDDPYFKYKLFKQLALILAWICLGLYMEIVGPVLPDLKDRLGIDYEQMSKILIWTSIGVMTGSPLSGFLHERLYNYTELLVAFGLVLAGASTIMLPYVKSIPLAGVCFYLYGFTEALINIGGNTIVMHTWGDKAAPPMHSLHFGFGLGALLGPQIAKPFLSKRNANVTDKTTDITTATDILISTIQPAPKSRIEYVFIIGGSVAILCSLLWIFIYFKGFPKGFPRRSASKTSCKMFSPASCARGDMLMGILVLLTVYLYFAQIAGGQRTYGRFIFSFLVDGDLKFTEVEAANLNTLFWGSYTFGRLTGIPIASFIPTQIMIAIQAVGLVISCSALAAFASSRITMWIATVPLGYFMAQSYPSGMAWSNIYLDVNSIAVMVFSLGSATGRLVYQYLLGDLLHTYGQNTIPYLMVAYSVGLLTVFIFMQSAGSCFIKRKPRVIVMKENVHEPEAIKISYIDKQNR